MVGMYTGICEDNNSDPLKMGRIKIRVFGVHTEIRTGEEDHKGLSVDDLPWAIPCFPSTPSIDGVSNFGVPAQGSIVLVSFLDEDKQYPVYFGTMPKIPNALPDFTTGFTDPNKQHPSKDYLKESPISRLARNEKIEETSVQVKKDGRQIGVRTNKTSFNELETEYDAEYPYNQVIESASGHVIEIDDTPGKERINVYHTSGSFIEIYPDGSLVKNVKGSETSITISDNNILIKGEHNFRLHGTQNVQIDGSDNIKVGGDVLLDVGGSVTVNSAEGVDIDGGSGSLQGVVTGSHICHYTGKPHGSKSGTVKASI